MTEQKQKRWETEKTSLYRSTKNIIRSDHCLLSQHDKHGATKYQRWPDSPPAEWLSIPSSITFSVIEVPDQPVSIQMLLQYCPHTVIQGVQIRTAREPGVDRYITREVFLYVLLHRGRAMAGGFIAHQNRSARIHFVEQVFFIGIKHWLRWVYWFRRKPAQRTISGVRPSRETPPKTIALRDVLGNTRNFFEDGIKGNS